MPRAAKPKGPPSDSASSRSSGPERRGLDGITVAELQRGRHEWWDEAFTRLLLEAIPSAEVCIVDVGCGTGWAAQTLLPQRSEARYIGVEPDAERLAVCRKGLEPWSDRASATQGTAEALPLRAGSADVVLTVTTLEHLADVPKALKEILRVLAPHGRIVAVEPDNLCQILRFDGPLDALEEAFNALFIELRRRRQPADLALGPRLPALLRQAGFQDVAARVHAVQSLHDEPAEDFFDRLSGVLATVAGAGGFAGDDTTVAAVRKRIDAERKRLAGQRGYSAHVVPMWRCTGRKPK